MKRALMITDLYKTCLLRKITKSKLSRMKNIFIYLLSALFLVSCSEDFLDIKPLTSKTDVAFYETEQDMFQALTAAYVVLVQVPEGGVVASYPFIAADLMSDDRFGGGGENDRVVRAIAEFKVNSSDMYWDMWARYYRGIFRLNMMLENIDKPTYTSEAVRNQVKGEAHFLRAMFYYDLVRMFGNVPLILESAPVNNPQAPAEEVYAQIASDLKVAIETFPKTPRGELGRANVWSAQALMARVFLFYTGYYETNDLPLAEGGSITRQQVVGWLEDCIANSGYKLMEEFRNLWPYSAANATNSEEPYKFALDNNLNWYGETGANQESMFMLKFSTFASWGTSIFYSNQMNLFYGWRDYAYKGTMGQGWGMGTVNSRLWEEWPNEDIRKRGSIINVRNADEISLHGVDNYGYGSDLHDSQMDETGLWQKKYRPINLKKDGQWANYSVSFYNATRDFQLDNMQDIVLIRFADVHLMHAELTQTVAGINAVRSRVGLPAIDTYSLDALKKERRYELAFEGLRYHDILRWAGKSKLSTEVKQIIDAQSGVQVINNGVVQTKTFNFRPETGGFIQIPNREINLSNGVLKQNPGWGADAPYY